MTHRVSTDDDPFCLVVIGGGPTCTYVVERLAATFLGAYASANLDVHIIETTGFFGAGAVHSPAQPDSSLLNRIAGQVSFAADLSNDRAEFVLPAEWRPTLHQWCAAQFAETGEARFNVRPDDWPRRNVHGLALCDMFSKYVALLRSAPGVRVSLHETTVSDVSSRGGRYVVALGDTNSSPPIFADHVLVLTGHSQNRPEDGSLEHRLEAFANDSRRARYVPYAYPLESRIPDHVAGPDRVVGCAGLGLTAIDVILYLTEGRGGVFVTDPTSRRQVYRASGREPKQIVGYSRCGLFTTARPHNAKEVDPDRLEHRGRFLTESSIDRLRESVGDLTTLDHIGPRRQLDFEKHVLPLVILEMTLLYYQTLFGPKFGAALCASAQEPFEAFLAGQLRLPESAAEHVPLLCAPASALAGAARSVVTEFLSGCHLDEIQRRHPTLDSTELLQSYCDAILGQSFTDTVKDKWSDGGRAREIAQTWVSPWGLTLNPAVHQFDWESIRDPLGRRTYNTPSDYTRALLDFMDTDHLAAAQGNLKNPTKAACDGVWRDLRGVLGYAADFGGLTARSHRKFLSEYLRDHNRLANGACLQAMEKMVALIRCGLLDVSTGPMPQVSPDRSCGLYRIVGPATGAVHHVDCLIDARLHAPNVAKDHSPVISSLFESGLVRAWRNASADGSWYEPGGIHITSDFRPVAASGEVTPGLTILGAPTEGVMFFQIGAARPNRNHHVLNDVIRWTATFRRDFERSGRFVRRLPLLSRIVNIPRAARPERATTTAVILAAGRNSRMPGTVGPKSLLPLRGDGGGFANSFIGRQITLLQDRGVSEIIVVANTDNEHQLRSAIRGHGQIVVNPKPPEMCGSSASLLAAIDQLKACDAGIIVLDADIIYEPQILDRVLAPRRQSCLFTSAAVAQDDEEVRVYGHSARELRLIGKALPGVLTSHLYCFGESLGVIRVVGGDVCAVIESARWLDSSVGRRGGRAEHEDVWGCLLVAGRMMVDEIPRNLIFAECDTFEDYRRIREEVVPLIIEREDGPAERASNAKNGGWRAESIAPR